MGKVSVKNTMGKGEIARYKQFLLFPECFQKTRINQGLFGKGLKLVETRDYFFAKGLA